MTVTELLGNLREFYLECSNRGWCKVRKIKGKDFYTLFSSETNFTHLPLNYGKFPERCMVSPRLSSLNIKKIERVSSALDSSRLVSVTPRNNKFIIQIFLSSGKCIFKESLRLYSFRGFFPDKITEHLENGLSPSF